MSRVSIEALLSHPALGSPDTVAAFGVVEVRQAARISVGKFMNFTRAAVLPPVVGGE